MQFIDSLEPRRLFAAGNLDITYGTRGVVTDQITNGTVVTQHFAVQVGDRILVGGQLVPLGGVQQAYLFRYTAEGVRDSHFVANVSGAPRGVVLQTFVTLPDGGILVGGTSTGADEGSFKVIRLTASGKLDTTFGKNGVAKIAGLDSPVMSVGDDGNIVLAGSFTGSKRLEIEVARLNADGSLDSTFATGGIFHGTLDLVGEGNVLSRQAKFVAETDNGQVVIGGQFEVKNANSDVEAQYVARFNSDGSLDPVLAGGGVLRVFQGHPNMDSMVALDDGSMVITTVGGDTVNKYHSDGSPFKSFGAIGVELPVSGSVGRQINNIAVQSDGSIVVATHLEMYRITGGGMLDSIWEPDTATPNPRIAGLGSDGSILTSSIDDPAGQISSTIKLERRWREEGPAGLLSISDLFADPGGSLRFTVQWRDDDGVNVKSLVDSAIHIISPNGTSYFANFLGTTKPGNGTVRTAKYKLAAPGGKWDAADNGTYTVRLVGGKLVVKDNHGAVASPRVLGTFTVNIA